MAHLPLSALLSQPLVAFTIECDNEFERQMPHTTTAQGRTPGARYAPWLTSMTMWWTCLRYVGDEGITVARLTDLAGAHTTLTHLQRWGYIRVRPDPADARAKPPERDQVITLRPGGRLAAQAWAPLASQVEARWRQRLGAAMIAGLRSALTGVARRLDPALPACMPILGYPLRSEPAGRSGSALAGNEDHLAGAALPELLSKVLLAFAIDFEAGTRSLAVMANLIRVLDATGVPVAELPPRSGVSKEGIAMAMGLVTKSGAAEQLPKPGGRGKLARLTAMGTAAQLEYFSRTAEVEAGWRVRYGSDLVASLRGLLEPLADVPGAGHGPLWRGLEPYPDGWRASVRAPDTLPHYPMVLHRGGYPDGS
jgi:hypothetical protein